MTQSVLGFCSLFWMIPHPPLISMPPHNTNIQSVGPAVHVANTSTTSLLMIVSRMGFLTWLRSKYVEIDTEKTSHKWPSEESSGKGCCEREQAQMDVYSTEKTSTKKNLARVMTKSKSRTQTVTNGCVSRKGDELSYWQVSQHQRSCRLSKIKV